MLTPCTKILVFQFHSLIGLPIGIEIQPLIHRVEVMMQEKLLIFSKLVSSPVKTPKLLMLVSSSQEELLSVMLMVKMKSKLLVTLVINVGDTVTSTLKPLLMDSFLLKLSVLLLMPIILLLKLHILIIKEFLEVLPQVYLDPECLVWLCAKSQLLPQLPLAKCLSSSQ
jgi:hypothetical protein